MAFQTEAFANGEHYCDNQRYEQSKVLGVSLPAH